MREIKFRGFQPELKKWIYGSLIKLPNGGCFIFDYKDNFEDRVVVIPESAGQYTGLKDINGKEIYEGDIVKGLSSLVLKVVYINQLGGYYCTLNNKSLTYPLDTDNIKARGLTIIGNIYKNQDLLKS